MSTVLPLKLAAALAPPERRAVAWVEALAVPVIAISVGFALRPEDPFFIQAAFPWPLLATLIVALRYGVLLGVASLAALGVMWFFLAGAPSVEGPAGPWFLGGLLLALAAGEFSGYWRTENRRLATARRFLEERVAALNADYYLLKVSHDELEQERLAQPLSLRSALLGIRTAILDGGQAVLPGASGLLDILGRFARIEAGAIYPVSGAVSGHRIAPVATAFTGSVQAPDASDPLVRHALDHGVLAHVRTADLIGTSSSRYLVAAPIPGSASNGPRGLLLIERMPFLALNEGSLQLIAVLVGWYAASLEAPAADDLKAALPDVPVHFLNELARARQMVHTADVPCTLEVLRLPNGPNVSTVFDRLRRSLRDLDSVWEVDSGDVRVRVTLLALSDAAAADGYRDRITHWLEAEFDRDTAKAVRWSRIAVDDRDDFVASLATAVGWGGSLPPPKD